MSVAHGNRAFDVIVRRNARAKRMLLRVEQSGAVVLTLPRRTALSAAKSFVSNYAEWISARLSRLDRKSVV